MQIGNRYFQKLLFFFWRFWLKLILILQNLKISMKSNWNLHLIKNALNLRVAILILKKITAFVPCIYIYIRIKINNSKILILINICIYYILRFMYYICVSITHVYIVIVCYKSYNVIAHVFLQQFCITWQTCNFHSVTWLHI